MVGLAGPRDNDPLRLSNEDFTRSVHALFDTRAHAETARQDLLAAGITADAVVLVGQNDAVPGAEPLADHAAPGGFWETLKEIFMPVEDRNQFDEGLRRGGVTVAVRTDTSNHDRVIDILDRDGAVDLDERQESWRNDGWTGYTGRDPLAAGASPRPTPTIGAVEEDMSYTPASPATAGFAGSGTDHFPVIDERAPPIPSPGALPMSSLESATSAPSMGAADRLESGIRDIGGSRPRVRSYLRPVVPSLSTESVEVAERGDNPRR